MIFGNPTQFAIMMEYLPIWSGNGYKNGMFHFIINGQMFPNQAKVATLDSDIYYLLNENALISLPENEILFKMKKEEAFTKLLNMIVPSLLDPNVYIPDDFKEDYRYQASTDNLENDSCFVFAVCFNDQVRIIAAKVAYLSGNENDGFKWKNYQNFNIYEIITSKDEIKHIVDSTKIAYESINDI